MTPIVPDGKDWTWVLTRPCPECGYEVSQLDPEFVPDIVRENAADWIAALATDGVAVRSREDRWSTLEYGAHVRDVFLVFTDRFRAILEQDEPVFPNWDQDATAIERAYGEQDPAVVAVELAAAAEEVAAVIEGVRASEWARVGTRSNGTSLDLAGWVRYFAHDPLHHLWDVTGIGRLPA